MIKNTQDSDESEGEALFVKKKRQEKKVQAVKDSAKLSDKGSASTKSGEGDQKSGVRRVSLLKFQGAAKKVALANQFTETVKEVTGNDDRMRSEHYNMPFRKTKEQHEERQRNKKSNEPGHNDSDDSYCELDEADPNSNIYLGHSSKGLRKIEPWSHFGNRVGEDGVVRRNDGYPQDQDLETVLGNQQCTKKGRKPRFPGDPIETTSEESSDEEEQRRAAAAEKERLEKIRIRKEIVVSGRWSRMSKKLNEIQKQKNILAEKRKAVLKDSVLKTGFLIKKKKKKPEEVLQKEAEFTEKARKAGVIDQRGMTKQMQKDIEQQAMDWWIEEQHRRLGVEHDARVLFFFDFSFFSAFFLFFCCQFEIVIKSSPNCACPGRGDQKCERRR